MSSKSKTTREKILNAAQTLLEENHGLGVRMGDIAKAAKVSRQALYLHFNSKTALVSATRDYVDRIHKVDARIAAITTLETADLRLTAYVEFWADYLPKIYGLARALYASRELDEASGAAWEECMVAHFAMCEKIVADMRAEGHLAQSWDRQQAAQMMFNLLSFPMWEALAIHRGWSADTYAKRMLLMLHQGIFSAAR